MQAELEQHMFLTNNTVIRAEVKRDNISYRKMLVSSLNNYKYTELLALLDQCFFLCTSTQDRILIYVMSRSIADSLSAVLNCAVVHAQISDHENQIKSFEKGVQNILVATSALSAGYDYASIRVVIHYMNSHSLVDFSQETGRAGRDEREAYSYVLTTAQEAQVRKSDSKQKLLFKEYVSESVCRRKVLDRVFDNIITDQCMSNQAQCDLCHKRARLQAVESANYQLHQQQIALHKDQVI